MQANASIKRKEPKEMLSAEAATRKDKTAQTLRVWRLE